jgi:hypothetical protein
MTEAKMGQRAQNRQEIEMRRKGRKKSQGRNESQSLFVKSFFLPC